MEDRPVPVDVPSWWMDDFDRAARDKGYDNTALAKILMPDDVPERDYEKALSAARAKVTRFRTGKPDPVTGERKPIRTLDLVNFFGARLGLTPFVYFAAERVQAEAMSLAASAPEQILRAARQLIADQAPPRQPEPSHPAVTTPAGRPRRGAHTSPANVGSAARRAQGRATQERIFKKASVIPTNADRRRSDQGRLIQQRDGAKDAPRVDGDRLQLEDPRPRRPRR